MVARDKWLRDLVSFMVESRDLVALLNHINSTKGEGRPSFWLILHPDALSKLGPVVKKSPYLLPLPDFTCECSTLADAAETADWCSRDEPFFGGLPHYLRPIRHAEQQLGFVACILPKAMSPSDSMTPLVEQTHLLDLLLHLYLPFLFQTLKLEQAVRESETMYQSLFERIPVGLYRSTPDGDLITVNPAMTQMLGFKEVDRLLNLNASSLYNDPKDRERWKKIMDEFDQIMNFEFQSHRTNGDTIWINDSSKAIRSDQGDILYYEGVLQDITARKSMEIQWIEQFHRIRKEHEVILQLVTNPEIIRGDLAQALPTITEIISEVTESHVASVWRFSNDGRYILCEDSFQQDRDTHQSGRSLHTLKYPEFFHTATSGRAIAVPDVKNDNRCFRLYKDVWEQEGVRSILAAPIRTIGKAIGLFCLEQHQSPREWQPDEVVFCGEVADLIAQVFLNREIQQRTEYLEVFNRIISLAQFMESPKDLLQTAVQEVLRVTNTDLGFIRINGLQAFLNLTEKEVDLLNRAIRSRARTKPGPFTLHTYTLSENDPLRDLLRRLKLISVAFIPIVIPETGKTGAIFLASSQLQVWNDTMIKLLTSLGNELAMTIHRILLKQAVALRNNLSTCLELISEQLTTPHAPADVFAIIGNGAMRLLNTQKAAFFILDQEGRVKAPWVHNVSLEYIRSVQNNLETLPGFSLIEKNQPILIEDIQTIPGYETLHRLADMEGYRAVALWPLTFENQTQSAIATYFTQPHPINDVEQEIMTAFCRQASTALANAKLLTQIQHLAQRDPMTGLYNRRYFEEELEHAVATAQRSRLQHALLVIDVDFFRSLNEMLGQAAGNRILSDLAQILRSEFHRGDIIARVGIDLFAILTLGTDPATAEAYAERIRKRVSDYRFNTDDKTYQGSVSIGVTTIDSEIPHAAAALAQAETACHLAKKHGRNRVHIYDATDGEQSRTMAHEIHIAGVIRRALKENKLAIFFQPIVDLKTSTVHAYEVLLRLHDEQGVIQPAYSFVPIADRFILMPEIDQWVIAQSLPVLDRILQANIPTRLTINLSGQTLENSEYLTYIETMVADHAIAPSSLVFEITETTAMNQILGAYEFIHRMRERGVLFALDDFGIGFSTFGHIKQLPIDYIKIDMNFVRSMDTNALDEVLVQSIHNFCSVLGLKTIAEGVETRPVLDKLKMLGIPYAQGFYLGKPLPDIPGLPPPQPTAQRIGPTVNC